MAIPAKSPGQKHTPSGGTGQQKAKKSSLVTLKPGDVLFNEGDSASSLFIIQKGQLRLYRPKGKGFIELAVLRAGEVLGEMAYFSQDESEQRRSCSAQAIVQTDIIEISFVAFGKTMANLNPWFKTIINTLADRLRKTNAKVKELESNSMSLNYGSAASYQFFKSADIVRLLSSLFLVIKSHGAQVGSATKITKSLLKFYTVDIFGMSEIKFEEFLLLLKKVGIIKIEKDQEGAPNDITCLDVAKFRNLLLFYNKQRTLTDDKQLRISEKCEIFFDHILMQLQEKNEAGSTATVDLSAILSVFKGKNIPVALEDLDDAKQANLITDIVVGDNNKLTCKVQYDELKRVFLPVQLMNAIAKFNRSKTES